MSPKQRKNKHVVQGFIDDTMVHCYCRPMAICMYVVALVNCISFDEGEEMNKAIKQRFTFSPFIFASEISRTATILRCVTFTRKKEFCL